VCTITVLANLNSRRDPESSHARTTGEEFNMERTVAGGISPSLSPPLQAPVLTAHQRSRSRPSCASTASAMLQ
jgi:hypothetical protein